ncbi:hypothetical protein GCM10022393_08370 [Aquimarina addita]|uniref:Natural product n=1 Tax=Aquimarina addita TaxID=870485 RepID=A0ABP7XBY2_9FLAO
MKKSILNLGKALNKAEQKSINGGFNFTSLSCEIRCRTAERGTRCFSTEAGLAACDGNGGFVPF